jgi:hypothetical protein
MIIRDGRDPVGEDRRKRAEERRLIERGVIASTPVVGVKATREPARERVLTDDEIRRLWLATVAAFADEYLTRHARPHKRSWPEDERLLRRDIVPALGDLRIDAVTRRDIVGVIDAIRDRGANVQANRALTLMQRVFGFAG